MSMHDMMEHMNGMMPMMQGNQNHSAKIETSERFYGRERESGTATGGADPCASPVEAAAFSWTLGHRRRT
jgi:hypothetical protein